MQDLRAPGSPDPPARPASEASFAVSRLRKSRVLQGCAVLAFVEYGALAAWAVLGGSGFYFATALWLALCSLASWFFLFLWFPSFQTLRGKDTGDGRLTRIGRACERFAIVCVAMVHVLIALTLLEALRQRGRSTPPRAQRAAEPRRETALHPVHPPTQVGARLAEQPGRREQEGHARQDRQQHARDPDHQAEGAEGRAHDAQRQGPGPDRLVEEVGQGFVGSHPERLPHPAHAGPNCTHRREMLPPSQPVTGKVARAPSAAPATT